VAESIGRFGGFDRVLEHGTTVISPMVRHLAPICYLCAEAPSEEADHVIPKVHGGTDSLSNLGAACRSCNSSKADHLVELTPEQEGRLASQQADIQTALREITDDPIPFWQDYYSSDIEYAVRSIREDYGDDPQDLALVDREEALGYAGLDLDRVNDGYFMMPPEALVAIADTILILIRANRRS
jgi:hypothetical protein